MVEKLSGIPEPPPQPDYPADYMPPEPEGWFIKRTPYLPSGMPDLTPPEKPPDDIIAGEQTISVRGPITTKPLRKMKKPRKNLADAIPPGQFRMGI